MRAPTGARPAARALALELVGAVTRRARSTSRRCRRAASAPPARPSGAGARARYAAALARTAVGAADVDEPSISRDVRAAARRVAGGAVERLDSSTIANASRPPGRSCARAQRRNARAPDSPPSSWIICIGTMHRAKSSPSQLERRGRRRTTVCRLDARRRVARSAASSSASWSSAITRWPARARSSVDAPGAGADVEHRAAAVARRASSCQSGRSAGVGAALEVVPDRRSSRGRRACQSALTTRLATHRARRAARAAPAAPCRSGSAKSGAPAGRSAAASSSARRESLVHEIALGVDAGVLQPQRHLGGARAAQVTRRTRRPAARSRRPRSRRRRGRRRSGR